MENSSQFETLKESSRTQFTFPPHRRRPLRSATLCTLVRILSHCHDDSQRSHAVPQQPKLDNTSIGLGQFDEFTGLNRMESENLVVQTESLVDENREGVGSQGGFGTAFMEIDGLDQNIIRGNDELGHDNHINLVNSVGDEQQSSDGIFELINNLEDEFSIPELDVEEFQPTGQLEVDKDICIREACEVKTTQLDIDMIGVPSKPVWNNDEKNSPIERNMSGEVEGEMQWKGRELEKLVSASGGMNSSLCLTAGEEIEEGEISSDTGLYDESMDFLLEDAVSLEENRVDKVQISGDIIGKEEFTRNEQQSGIRKDAESTSLFGPVHSVGNGMEVELKENNINLAEDKSEMVVHWKTIEPKQADGYGCRLETGRIEKQGRGDRRPDSPAACPENLALCDEPSGENATENQVNALTEKDAVVCNKKKKRGPLTKEKRAKKKQKERIKRAEKNRKLGVKRLKLQPVLKPKTVTYCRHYLQGRCQEGEKCKFSHDTTPLTKSKPCCHFARHSCMKGDDCPFDHQLSKYPCINYSSTGSCGRGADCMFSHEVSVKEASPSASPVSKSELKPVESLLGNSNFKKQLNVYGTAHQKINANSCSIGISPSKSSEQSVAEAIPKPVVQAPQGISFLSHGKFSLGSTSKHKQSGSSPKADDNIKVGQQVIHGASEVVQKSNEITKRMPAVAPQGTSFQSFGKSPSDGSSSKKSHSLTFSRTYGIGKSPLSDSSKVVQAGSSLKGDGGAKVDNHTDRSAAGKVQNLNVMANRTPPAVAPRGINFLSFGKAQLDDSSNKKQASLSSSEDNAVPPSVERQSAYNQPQFSNAIPWMPPSSIFPRGQRLDRLVDGQSKSTPSSSQMSHLSNIPSSSSPPCGQPLDHLADGQSKRTPSSSQKLLLSNTPSSVQKALQSTLAFAAKFESEVKIDRSSGAPGVHTDLYKEAGSSQNRSVKAKTILDFLYGDSSKTKQ